MKRHSLDTSPWHQRKVRGQWSLFVLVLLALASGVVGVALERYLIDEAAFQLFSENQHLSDENILLNGENLELKRQISIHESASKIDQLSVEEAQKQLGESQLKLEEIREKLLFYQRIISPEKVIKGIHIRAFRLIGTSDNRRQKYILTLSQGADIKKAIKGAVSITVSGHENGVEKTLKLEVLDQEKKKTLSFNFRYLQSFTRSFNWPEGFLPDKVLIEVKPSGKKSKKIEQTWGWSKLEERAL